MAVSSRAGRTCGTVLSFAATAAALGLASTPAGAARPSPGVYDALGDSYASGAGVLPYDPGPCARSVSAPARLVDGRKRIALDDFVACGGAKAADIAGQVGVLDADTDLVSVSIGGNDIYWIEAVATCVLADETACAGAVNRSRAAVLTTLPGLLDTAYGSIDAAAPDANVLVTGYARLFSPESGDYVTPYGTVTTAEQQLMNDGADLLNAVIAERAAAHGFEFVDVTKRFAGHGVNAPDSWILGLGSPAAFHPNLAGYQSYAAAITANAPRLGR